MEIESYLVRRAHTYKGEKYLNKRLEEVNNTSSWNSMYLNNTTVMDVITHKLGVKTADILDVETGNMAVRVALAETEVLEDTRKWLEKEGVKIDILEVGEDDRLYSWRNSIVISIIHLIGCNVVGSRSWREGCS